MVSGLSKKGKELFHAAFRAQQERTTTTRSRLPGILGEGRSSGLDTQIHQQRRGIAISTPPIPLPQEESSMERLPSLVLVRRFMSEIAR